MMVQVSNRVGEDNSEQEEANPDGAD